jgi:hypothetical protein
VRRYLVPAAAAALALAGCFGENQYEKMADQVTKAIIANDMRPVEKDFNAIVRPKLLDRARVGTLSDQLNALGPLKRIKENTPSGARTGEHTFAVEFQKGTWSEDMTLDSEGKIASFYVRPRPSTSAGG